MEPVLGESMKTVLIDGRKANIQSNPNANLAALDDRSTWGKALLKGVVVIALFGLVLVSGVFLCLAW